MNQAQFQCQSTGFAWASLHGRGLILGLTLSLLGTGLDRALASSPKAWASYGQEVQQACLSASRLRQPRPAGDRLDLPMQAASRPGSAMPIA